MVSPPKSDRSRRRIVIDVDTARVLEQHRKAQARDHKLMGEAVATTDLVPTFRSPHVTIAWARTLDEGLRELDRTEHDDRTNPYHD